MTITKMFLDSHRHGIDLHLHVDGSLRPSTLFRWAKKRGISLSVSDVEELETFLTVKNSDELSHALEKLDLAIKIVKGDKVSELNCFLHLFDDTLP